MRLDSGAGLHSLYSLFADVGGVALSSRENRLLYEVTRRCNTPKALKNVEEAAPSTSLTVDEYVITVNLMTCKNTGNATA